MALKSSESNPICAICGQPIGPGESRLWTYGKTTFYHETCYQKEVDSEDGTEEAEEEGDSEYLPF